MLGKKLATLVHHLRDAAAPGVEHSDAEALSLFVHHQDQGAFRLLLERHAPMVRAVCRHVLKTDQDAEDAFQAAFLVLARKAASIQRRHALAGWLYRVAYRLALSLRARNARRQLVERQAPVKTEPFSPADDLDANEVRSSVLAEVDRLPESYRAALVLCALEGKSTDEAAAALGWSEGTVRARLWRGRKLLMARLERRQVLLSTSAVAALLACHAPVSAAQLDHLTHAALLFAAHQPTGCFVSEQASLLAGESLATGTRRLLLAGVLAAGVLAVAATVGAAFYLSGAPQPAVEVEPAEPVLFHAQEQERPATDLHGDPLPPQAIARLGTQRFRHEGGLRAVAIAPDGKIIASGANVDESVRLWDIASGKQVARFYRKEFWPHQLAYSPSGKRLAVCGFHGPLVLWDVEQGRELAATEQVSSPYEGVVFCSEALLATAHWDKTIRFWDDKGQAAGKIDAHDAQIADLAARRDGTLLASVAQDGTLHLWDPEKKTAIAKLKTPDDPRSVRFSADGQLVIVGAEKAAALYDVAARKELRRFAGKNAEDRFCVFAAAISPDGQVIATGGANAIYLWNRESQEPTGTIPWTCPHTLVFSPDGKTLLATEYNDHVVHAWDVATRKERCDLPGHHGLITSVSFSPDGKQVLSRCTRNHLFVWDATSGKVVRDTFMPRTRNLPVTITSSQHRTVAAYSADGALFACGRDDSTIHVYETATGKEIHLLLGHTGSVNAVVFSPRQELLISVGREPTIRLWDLKTGKQLRVLTGHVLDVECLAIAPNGRLLASGAAGEFQVADQASPQGRIERDGTIRLWDLETGKELFRFEVGESIQSVRFSPDGSLIAAGVDDRICIWEVASGKKIKEWYWGEEDRVAFSETVFDFSPDGRLIAYNNRPCIRIRDLATFEEVGKIAMGSNPATALAFAPAGKRLASGHR
ncbi:MAG: sigma-70 family RNA polymerase sigma factor, partial [Gemmataceae bacterium]